MDNVQIGQVYRDTYGEKDNPRLAKRTIEIVLTCALVGVAVAVVMALEAGR